MRTFKEELLWLREWTSPLKLKQALIAWIEWYSTQYWHSGSVITHRVRSNENTSATALSSWPLENGEQYNCPKRAMDSDMIHKPTRLTHPEYRADIDGLRAIAVLSVVGYHAFPYRIAGGFIGVDIFFVISGFLISSIIFSNLERDSFGLVEFYNRRIRRIFPALITVMIASLVLGWFALLNSEYKQLGKHIVGGAGFVSNVLLWKESGYFDNAAQTKPMLHLWSLAIEEQFYIFWPLLLAFVWKRHWSFLRITALIAVASFAVNIYLIGRNPMGAFYLPITRFWELMIGGVLAYITLHRPNLNSEHKNAQSVFGFLLLVLALVLINNKLAYPSWWALLPTLGAFFIISAGPGAFLNHKLLSNNILVWFGLISYPLYLWHWPLLSFTQIVEIQTPTVGVRVSAIALSVLLAWLTYGFIEKPVRFGKNNKLKAVSLLLSLVIVGCLGLLCFKENGFSGFRNWSDKSEFIDYFENSLPEWKYVTRMGIHFEQCNFHDLQKFLNGQATKIPLASIDKTCYTRNNAYDHSVFIWGDSHASHLEYGLKNRLPNNWQILQVTSSGCAANPNVQEGSKTDYCVQSNWFALNTIKNTKPNVVIVAQRVGHSSDKMHEIYKLLSSLGVGKVIFAGPAPQWTADLPQIIVRRLWDSTLQRTYIGIDKNVLLENEKLKEEIKQKDGVNFVSLIDFFCNSDGCLTYIGDDKKTGITAWDNGHLTHIASDYLAEQLLLPLVTEKHAKNSEFE